MTTGNRDSVKLIHRLFCEVVSERADQVTLRLITGQKITRSKGEVAFYIKPPVNWDLLYLSREIMITKNKEALE